MGRSIKWHIRYSFEERSNIISKLKNDFHVIAEVGSKDPHEDMPISDGKKK